MLVVSAGQEAKPSSAGLFWLRLCHGHRAQWGWVISKSSRFACLVPGLGICEHQGAGVPAPWPLSPSLCGLSTWSLQHSGLRAVKFLHSCLGLQSTCPTPSGKRTRSALLPWGTQSRVGSQPPGPWSAICMGSPSP